MSSDPTSGYKLPDNNHRAEIAEDLDVEVHPLDHPWADMYSDDYDNYGFDEHGNTAFTF